MQQRESSGDLVDLYYELLAKRMHGAVSLSTFSDSTGQTKLLVGTIVTGLIQQDAYMRKA